MFLINRWSNKVDDKIFVLLEKWVEKRICSICKTPYLPVETERYIVEKKYNRFGVAIFETILLKGVENTPGTKQHDITEVDIFGFDVFLNLDEIEQICVLAYIDPFDELKGKENWKEFLDKVNIRGGGEYDRILRNSFINMQNMAQNIGLVDPIEE